MKKIIYLFALAVLITACSKDDETPKYIDENLIGEWEMLECYQTTNNTGIINIDSAKYYEIFNDRVNVFFSPDTTCGFTQIFPYSGNSSTFNYHSAKNNIVLTKLCERKIEDFYYFYYFYSTDDEIYYKLINSTELLIVNKYKYNNSFEICYGFYKRKE